ncbi:protein turtle homolog B-like isoform X2 [Anthonomus grandis grandis]|uniref:protein turtle homolog B-like isoform X2 n=1 Tax=Anthonomus grandis grandis TaxID=2921223 RepID=UPI002165E483|nr:protein turtle homolog B-like isoform X2 [Anthonomus grandis grandis]
MSHLFYFCNVCVVYVICSFQAFEALDLEVPIVHMKAVQGEPVFLPCDISMPDPKDKVLLVLWYREDLGTPIYSVDGRDRDFSIAERWSDDKVFSNRAYFIQDKQPAELGIDHIRESDQAVYRCRVDFKMGQTRNSKVNLTVIVPPTKVTISNEETGQALSSVVGPFPEGASFTLRCDVFGGKPPPTVTWLINDQPVENSSNVGITPTVLVPNNGKLVRSDLRIENLSRKDVHSEITCQATNNNKTPPHAATLHVDMNFGPLDVKLLGPNQPLSAGRRYDLLCQSTGSRPPATITWWKNGQRLERSKDLTSNDGNMTTSTLTFIPKKEDDGKYLSCRAENKVLSSESLEDGWKLEIHYTPEARIILGTSLNPNAVREGTDVYFDCIINAHPPAYKVEWRHNGKHLQVNVNAGIIISNQSLVLQGVSRSTAGNYTCVGYNLEGEGESNAFYLNVLYAPTCKPDQTRIYGVAKQERAEIVCQVDANPPEVNFKWTFNNSADSVDVSSNHIAKTGTSSVVSYTPITELDYGTLLCYASNNIGMQRVPCVFHIIAAGRPDQVHNCSTTNISMTSLQIRCAEGFNGGLTQAFLLEMRESQTQHTKYNLTSPVARFSVNHLEPGAQYQAVLFAYNSKGRSEPVILQASTLRLPEKQLTAERDSQRLPFRFTPLMSVIIGVVSALLIVLLVVILVLRVQCAQGGDHRRKEQQRHKNAVVSSANLEHRGSGSGATLSDKGGGSPVSKHESSAGECDSDEKNPDIIPQPVDMDDGSDYSRKKQHVSTIETSSPSRSLLHPAGNSGYMGYCTLRNGMPMHELNAQSKLLPGPTQMMSAYSTSCTLPRQPPQTWQYGPVSHLPPGMYPVQYRGGPVAPPRIRATQTREPPIPLQPLVSAPEEEPSPETPLMANKRESTV